LAVVAVMATVLANFRWWILIALAVAVAQVSRAQVAAKHPV